MKVASIRTKPVRIDLPKPIGSALGEIRALGCLAIFVETDEGLVGENLIFSLHNRHLALFDEMIRLLSPLILNRDPLFTGAFWAEAWRSINFVGHKGVSIVGISALDGALWDIRGKAAGLPICKLVGACHTELPVYASGGLWLDSTIDELQKEATDLVASGYRAIKMRLGMPKWADDVVRVKAVREAVGPDVKLLVDANQRYTVSEAIRIGRKLEAFDLEWFEEPLPAYDLEGCADVVAALDVPVASGETEYTRYGFRRMLELKSADILMPDLQRVGGVTEFVKVAHMAEAYNVPVSSHLFSEMSLQVMGAIANASYVEWMPWFSCLYAQSIEIKDGMARISDQPGWGVNLDSRAVERLGLEQ